MGGKAPDGRSSPKVELESERARLVRLWDAYEMQERELQAARERIALLEGTVAEQGQLIHRPRAALAEHGSHVPGCGASFYPGHRPDERPIDVAGHRTTITKTI